MEKTRNEKESMIAWGRDEMNLVELPFGPITPGDRKTLEVHHSVFDPLLRREVQRTTLITGSDAFGLPRPIDDSVLVGMMALTYESGFESPRVNFSIYELCRAIGWRTDGRSYRRVEASLNRITGTTLQFKDAWYDKGNEEFTSKTFHLVDEVDLRTRQRIDRARMKGGGLRAAESYFVWNSVVWKSFQDGFIRGLDMTMFRRVSAGRRREVAIRLYRLLAKRFYKPSKVRFEVEHLAVGILGVSPNYAPSQLRRVLSRAADWLVECGFLGSYRYCPLDGLPKGGILFRKHRRSKPHSRPIRVPDTDRDESSEDCNWFKQFSDGELLSIEKRALASKFGTEFERNWIQDLRVGGEELAASGALRRSYIRRYFLSTEQLAT